MGETGLVPCFWSTIRTVWTGSAFQQRYHGGVLNGSFWLAAVMAAVATTALVAEIKANDPVCLVVAAVRPAVDTVGPVDGGVNILVDF